MHFCIVKCIVVSCILFGCGQIKSQETADQHVRIPPWVMEPSADGTVIIGDVDGITVRLASESIRSIAVSSCFGDVSDLPYLSKGDDVYYPEPFCAADGKSIFFHGRIILSRQKVNCNFIYPPAFLLLSRRY